MPYSSVPHAMQGHLEPGELLTRIRVPLSRFTVGVGPHDAALAPTR